MQFNFKKVYYVLLCLIAFFFCIYYGRPLIAPICTALLLAFILLPICVRLERVGFSKVMAALTSIALAIIILASLIYLFSSQIASLTHEFSAFESKLKDLMDKTIVFAQESLNLKNLSSKEIINDTQEWVQESGPNILSSTFSQTTTTLSGTLMIIVYTFLLLIYRTGFKNVILNIAQTKDRDKTLSMLQNMQKVGKDYVVGMSIMIAILGLANSLILLAFGIEHPFFFGFLAAFLSVIPYVGTTFGALIPVLYAFVTMSSYWVPLGIIFSFWLVQLVESNFLSPKIVGGHLNINAFAAIVSLIIGGYMWGVLGMALFLPLTAIFKVFCSHFEQLKPVSALLSNDLYEHHLETANATQTSSDKE